jgi:hypothetical protein
VSDNQDWDCPTCGRPAPTEIDVECHCGMMASHHVSVWTMCHRLREVQQRESALIVENNEQARLLGMSAERECDLRGEMNRMKGLLIRLYNDLFIIHNGVAIADLKKEFREENYN